MSVVKTTLEDAFNARKAWLALRENVLHEVYGAGEDVAVLDKFFDVKETE